MPQLGRRYVRKDARGLPGRRTVDSGPDGVRPSIRRRPPTDMRRDANSGRELRRPARMTRLLSFMMTSH